MANKRPKPEEIVSKLRQVEVLTRQGMSRLNAIRQIGVVEQTYYRWRKECGGMGVLRVASADCPSYQVLDREVFQLTTCRRREW